MENDNVEQLLQYKEGQHFDRKRKRKPREIADLLVAFANANQSGGLVLVGVENDGKVYGLRSGFGDNYRNELARCSEYISHVSLRFRFIPVNKHPFRFVNCGMKHRICFQ